MFWLQENLILMKEMGNCPEFHSWRSNFLQNLHFSAMENLDLVILYCRIITKKYTAISDSLQSLKAK